MPNPFAEEKYPDEEEKALVERAREGDREALDRLVRGHQAWIYNIALRMVYDRDEAADVTMEVLLKMMTRLSTFRGESSFRTWLYRIALNHVLNMKKSAVESMVSTFSEYGKSLDEIENAALPDPSSAPADLKLLVEEAKISCMTGMLLCLDREQRVAFILGEIFGVSDRVGAELLEIEPANFRQRLSRARRDLYNFMNEKCGLINTANPCRCARKTRGFIERGIVDPRQLKFTREHYQAVRTCAPARSQRFEYSLEPRYAALYRDHPMQAPPDFVDSLDEMLNDREFRDLFDLEP